MVPNGHPKFQDAKSFKAFNNLAPALHQRRRRRQELRPVPFSLEAKAGGSNRGWLDPQQAKFAPVAPQGPLPDSMMCNSRSSKQVYMPIVDVT